MGAVRLPHHRGCGGRGFEIEAVEAPPVLQRDPPRLLEALQPPKRGRPVARAGPAVAPARRRRAWSRAARARGARRRWWGQERG